MLKFQGTKKSVCHNEQPNLTFFDFLIGSAANTKNEKGLRIDFPCEMIFDLNL